MVVVKFIERPWPVLELAALSAPPYSDEGTQLHTLSTQRDILKVKECVTMKGVSRAQQPRGQRVLRRVVSRRDATRFPYPGSQIRTNI